MYNHTDNYATSHYTTLDYTTLNYSTLHYTRPITPPQYNYKCTTLITAHHNHNSTTLLQQQQQQQQQQLQLHYTTLLPAVVCEVTDQVTIATIVTTPKSKIPTSFQSISGFALPSVVHNYQPLL